jgi:monoamine oxidase
MKPKITILGAGLSGLLIAYRLKKLGFNIQILEAKSVLVVVFQQLIWKTLL